MVQEEYTIKPAEMPVFSIILQNSFILQPDSFKNSIKISTGLGCPCFQADLTYEYQKTETAPIPWVFVYSTLLCAGNYLLFFSHSVAQWA